MDKFIICKSSNYLPQLSHFFNISLVCLKINGNLLFNFGIPKINIWSKEQYLTQSSEQRNMYTLRQWSEYSAGIKIRNRNPARHKIFISPITAAVLVDINFILRLNVSQTW